MRKAIITCDFCGKEIVTGKVGKTWHTITWHGGLTKMSKDICGECWDERLLAIKPEDYTELKREFLRMASYIDVLLECSDEQKETLIGFISRLAEFMPWTERD